MTEEYYRGATGGMRVNLITESGEAANITTYTRVRAAVAVTKTSTVLIARDTLTDGVTKIAVIANPASVDIFPTLAESLALPLGLILVQVWVTIGGVEMPAQIARYRIKEGVGEPAPA
jgi:hypothetical protein